MSSLTGTGISCAVASLTFSSLATAGTTTNCAKSGCHNTATSQQNLDITSYNSVINKVISGNPTNSLLYQKITTGFMATNSNTAINNAVYCWIQGGIKP